MVRISPQAPMTIVHGGVLVYTQEVNIHRSVPIHQFIIYNYPHNHSLMECYRVG